MYYFRNSALALLGLTVILGVTLASNITTTYDPTKDYFPEKVTFENPAFAKFNIEYHNSWIYLQYPNPEHSNYILYQRGTPKPERIGLSDIFLEIPLEHVRVEYSTATSYLEMLGLRDHIGQVEPELFSPACMDSRNFTYGNADATFTPNRNRRGPRVIYIEAVPELEPLAKLELLKFYALFFNKEKEANTIVKRIDDNYNCIKNRVAAAKEKSKPKIAWVSTINPQHHDGLVYIEYMNDYFNRLLQDADALPIYPYEKVESPSLSYSYAKSVSMLHKVIKTADILVDMTSSTYENATFPSASDVLRYYGLSETNTTFEFIKNKAIYRLDKRQTSSGRNDWIFDAVVMPDAALEDVANIAHPGFQENYSFHWMRNVFNQDNQIVTKCPYPTLPLVSVAYTCTASNFSSINNSSTNSSPSINTKNTTDNNASSTHLPPSSHSGYATSTQTGPYVALAFLLTLTLL